MRLTITVEIDVPDKGKARAAEVKADEIVRSGISHLWTQGLQPRYEIIHAEWVR